jgi:hypothetical protein
MLSMLNVSEWKWQNVQIVYELELRKIQMIVKWTQNITNEKEVSENQCGFGKRTEYI